MSESKKYFENKIIDVETNSRYFFNNLSLIFEKSISYYQLFINILFLFIIIMITYVLYLDIIHKVSDNIPRCKEIKNIVKINYKIEKPYFYRIYIVDKSFSTTILDDYSICLEYDFINEKTNIIFGKKIYINRIIISDSTPERGELSVDINNPLNISKKLKAFAYFDLESLDHKYIEYIDYDNITDTKLKSFYVNKNIILRKNYSFIVTDGDNRYLNNKEATQLKKFVKEYGYDSKIQPTAIYNIIYAIEHHKNTDVI